MVNSVLEGVKKIYVKLKFLYRKYIKRHPKIWEVEKENLEAKREAKVEYKKKLEEIEVEKEKKLLSEHIDYNLNAYRLIRYKDKHHGARCFIIGNGPSLIPEDLEKLKKEYSIGCNKIFKIFPHTEWRPSYYLVEDSLAYKNNIKEIRKIPSPKFISDIALNVTKLPLVNMGIKFFDYLYYWDVYPDYPLLTVDFTKEVWCAYNAAYQMINLAIYMGFKEIYLLGVDFNFDFTNLETKLLKMESGETHQVLINKGGVNNHFGDSYLEEGEVIYPTDLKYAKKAFTLLKKEEPNLGIRIYNATRGGKLEIFERVNFDDLFSK